jgi:chromosome partitioning related protein ParA
MSGSRVRPASAANARVIGSGIREDFITLKGRVSVLDTVVPHAKAYKEAATLRVPVHRHERKREGAMPSAYTVMHALAWELIPSLQGVLVDSVSSRDLMA